MTDNILKALGHSGIQAFLGISEDDINDVLNNFGKYSYTQFKIQKKNGGIRNISAPSSKLKIIQDKLKSELYDLYEPRSSVHGFALNKSIVTNASTHVGRPFLFNIDLANFFQSISIHRIKGLLTSRPFNLDHDTADVLSRICCYKGSLPQGASTSPILSNMISWKLDKSLELLAKNANCLYSRYADDITFSFDVKSKNDLPISIVHIEDKFVQTGAQLNMIIEKNGFKINHSKTRLCDICSRREVTGLTVNEFVNVKRSYIRQLSAMLNAWEKYGIESAQSEFDMKYIAKFKFSKHKRDYSNVVKGKLAFLKNVRPENDHIYCRLNNKFQRLMLDRQKDLEGVK